MATTVNKIKNFRKSHLAQGTIAQLCQTVYTLCMAASIDALSVVLNILRDKIDYFNALIHPIMGSSITAEIIRADERRDEMLVGFNYYIEFAARHTESEMVAAAKRIQVVLNNASYKGVYRERYDRETNTIMNLLQELRNRHAEDIETLQIGFYLDALEEANNDFEALKTGRAGEISRPYTSADIRAARTEMEHAFDLLRTQLNGLADMAGMAGDDTDYASLIALINTRIDEAIQSNDKKDDDEQPANNGENGNNNQGGTDNNGGDNNTDPNQGDDNTPSANA